MSVPPSGLLRLPGCPERQCRLRHWVGCSFQGIICKLLRRLYLENSFCSSGTALHCTTAGELHSVAFANLSGSLELPDSAYLVD